MSGNENHISVGSTKLHRVRDIINKHHIHVNYRRHHKQNKVNLGNPYISIDCLQLSVSTIDVPQIHSFLSACVHINISADSMHISGSHIDL